MSKAREWASFMKEAKRPAIFESGFIRAEVNDYGDCQMELEAKAISPAAALRLARWIQDMFGEEAP